MMTRLILMPLFLVSFHLQAEMMPMDSEEMSQITGQEGISMSMEFRLNTDANGDLLSDIPEADRRLALQFEGRDWWLLVKDYYGQLKYSEVWLDAGEQPASATPYEDLSRFTNQKGETVSPHGQSALKISFPGPIEGFYSLGLGLEYSGYDGSTYSDFIGLEMGNSNPASRQASLQIDGSINMFGF